MSTASKFNISNAEQLIYEHEYLRFTVLGGIRLEGLDRMRATLKVELQSSSVPPVRHNLDLYNDTQLEKLIRKIAERLEIGTSLISASLSALTDQLEQYRMDQLKNQQLEYEEIEPMSPAARKAATKLLSSENLMEQTLKALSETGIIGESYNSMILFLAMTSRKCADPLNVVCLAGSGVGKSYLMESVAKCMPWEDLKEQTQFSGNSLYYFKREELRGKVILIEDLEGAQSVLFPIRELQTKKRISKTVTIKDKQGQLRTITLIVEGPVSVVACTTKEQLYEDNANRSILIYLDSSREQDERILTYHGKKRAGLIDETIEQKNRKLLQDAQRLILPIKVVNPYAPLIKLPQEIFKPRRTLPLLLSFIESITFYHQNGVKQILDKESGEVYIETEPKHIEWAFKLLRDVLFRKSDELSGACRSFYEWLKSNIEPPTFYGKDIRAIKRIHPRTLNRYLAELKLFGLLEITGGNKHKTGYSYRLSAQKEKDLQKSIDDQINKVMKAVEKQHNKRIK